MTDPTPTRDEAVLTGWQLVPVDPTEEMIEAMREAARKASRGGISGMTIDAQFRAEHRPEYASYAAMLASARAPASGRVDAVAVKALEWTERHSGSWVARAIGLLYVVVDRQWWIDHIHVAAQLCESDEAAKAAAQADYEQRIRSALSPAATPVSEAEPVAWRWRYEGEPSWSFRQTKPTDWPDIELQALYLAKPASSPAGGDVARAIYEGMGYNFNSRTINAMGQPYGAWAKAVDCAQRVAALSQSTSAGRVGE